QLKPTMDLHGQLLGPDDKPLAFHGIRVQPRGSGQRDLNKSFATSFPVMTFEARTDKNGNYTLSGLPIELDMRLQADPINGSQQDEYLQEFYLVPGEQRSRIVSRLAQASETETRSVVERYDSALRMAKLDNYYVLVLCYDATSSDFVNSNMLDPYAIPEVASFLHLHIDENSLTQHAHRQFVEA